MRTLVVTGGSQGIGAATCRLAAQRGWAVCLSYARSRDWAISVADAVRAEGGQALAVEADAAEEEGAVRLFQAAAGLGPIEGVVINAGITGPHGPLDMLEAADLDRVLAVNVRGALLTLREAARRMHSGGIVAVSSVAARLGGAHEWVHYAASKGAVDSMTIGAARELAGRGIRVNAVLPGLIETGLHARAGLPDRLATLAPGIPMGRGGTPEEVARVILWLLSDEASYVTGALVPVAGGR
jgi:NAD(P)-dependent dehydrogenase (short-subunit alcohol dehydrogenase family)